MAGKPNNTPGLRPKCLFDGCAKTARRRGLCMEHWKFAREDDALEEFPTELILRRAKADGAGFVYVMHSQGLHKVGKTQCLVSRLYSIQNATSAPVELVYCAKTDIPLGVEAAAHRLLSDKRVRGEWFACSQAEAAEAINMAMEQPASRKRYLRSDVVKTRVRPIGYFDKHRMPKYNINRNGRKHPDLILD